MKKFIVILLVMIVLIFFNGEKVYSKERNSFVTFSNVSSETLKPTIHEDTIELGNIELSYVGDKKEVQFELENISDYDSTIEITINGSNNYQNEYLKITTTDIKEIKKHSKKQGTLTIELIKESEEDLEIPFNINILANQK